MHARSRINDTSAVSLGKNEFNRVKKMLHDYSGIFLHDGKEALVRARLMKRLRKLGLGSFTDYLNFIEADVTGGEFLSLVDVLTTNKTSFFREKQHYDYLVENVIPQMNNRQYKWWSAGCSSGEEPVTLAMTLLEQRDFQRRFSVKMLATDLSRDILQRAKSGIYSSDKTGDLPEYYLQKYFNRHKKGLEVKPYIKELITYGRLNLLEKWPMKGPFHVIMCRNVMIYFNRQTQMELVSRFYDLLEPGGYLFLGHSESVSGDDHGFVNVSPAAYQKQ
jgi:chemotaxis protein methyltransferase CheR